jgi:alkanesulfonate monooxygenase SsuD/methylene tetrahydromethanopterin reductase-like flavin-dependent oxidoreductase (luciferase family)
MADRIGVVLSLSSIEDTIAAGRYAEQTGMDGLWATEFIDRSGTVAMAALACNTETIGIGSAVSHTFGRTPVILAAEIRDLDALSGGRLTIGLGTGTKRMQRDWHGIDGEHPAPRVEELIPLVRRLINLCDGPVVHEGRFYSVRVTPTAPVPEPLRRDPPIYLAGVNARMCEAVGRVGDGLVGHPLFTPGYTADVVRPALARGAERGEREAPPIAGYLTTSVHEDRDQARNDARAVVAFNSTVMTYRAIHEHMGFTGEADAVRAAWMNGDFAGMIGAVSDEMLDTYALAGTAEEVRKRFIAERSGLYEQTLLWPPAHQGLEGTRRVIEAFKPLL